MIHVNPRRFVVTVVVFLALVALVTFGVIHVATSSSSIRVVSRSSQASLAKKVASKPKASKPKGKPAQQLNATPNCQDPALAVDAALQQQGFQPDQYVIGQGNFDTTLPGASIGGDGSFSSNPLTTSQQLVSFLQTGNPQNLSGGQAVQGWVMAQSGASASQVLNPSNWIGFQMKVPVLWTGNSVFASGATNPVKSAGTLNSQNGDIGWVFVDPSKCTAGQPTPTSALTWDRGGCGNPESAPPSPVPPPTPAPAPQTQQSTPPPSGSGGCTSGCGSTPTCPPGEVPSTYNGVCVTPKNPSEDVNVNPAVPAPVRGPGTTPVGTSPGPASAPVDSSTGCPGACPGSSGGGSSSSPPATSQPPPVAQPPPTPTATDSPASQPIPGHAPPG